jgi:hypothetical protein
MFIIWQLMYKNYSIIVLFIVLIMTMSSNNIKEFIPLSLSLMFAFLLPQNISDIVLRGMLFNYYFTTRLYS